MKLSFAAVFTPALFAASVTLAAIPGTGTFVLPKDGAPTKPALSAPLLVGNNEAAICIVGSGKSAQIGILTQVPVGPLQGNWVCRPDGGGGNLSAQTVSVAYPKSGSFQWKKTINGVVPSGVFNMHNDVIPCRGLIPGTTASYRLGLVVRHGQIGARCRIKANGDKDVINFDVMMSGGGRA